MKSWEKAIFIPNLSNHPQPYVVLAFPTNLKSLKHQITALQQINKFIILRKSLFFNILSKNEIFILHSSLPCHVEFPFIFLIWKWLANYTGLSERNLKFCQLPPKTTNCLRANVRKLYNICSSFLCRKNLCSETEQNNVNLSYYFGVIVEIMWYSDSEQPVL